MALLVAAALLSSSTSAMAQAGSLDLTFGNGGIVTTPGTSDPRGMAIQSDGKIVVAGAATAPEFVLARYNTDSTLDAAFGNGGIVAVPTNNGGPAFAVAIQNDGKIVTAAPTDLDVFVFRFNADGALDQSFGSGGKVQLGVFAPGPQSGAIAVQSDGKILVAAGGLTRLRSDGQFDPSFGTGGVAPTIPGGFDALVLLGSGKILLGASQYNADGSVDSSFGVAGQVPNVGQPAAISLLSNGQFVVAGALASKPARGINPQGFVVVRYNGDGTIDASFGTHGAAVTNFPGNNFSRAFAVAVQSNGDIVAAGFTAAQNCVCAGQASDFALARYTADGQLDTTFGTNGLVITNFQGDAASISALAIQSDSKIVALGRDTPASFGSHPGFTIARYLSQ
jgi:uncharacterized delta-60 repeat protein